MSRERSKFFPVAFDALQLSSVGPRKRQACTAANASTSCVTLILGLVRERGESRGADRGSTVVKRGNGTVVVMLVFIIGNVTN
jgi:hypothetical protein